MPADVAERGRAQQRIADGMKQSIAVRMAQRTQVERDLHAAQNQRAARDQTVQIVADTGAVGARNYEF